MRASAADKRKMQREVRDLQRRLLHDRLTELKGLIAVAREARRAAVKAVQSDCAARRVALREQCHARKAEAKDAGARDVAGKRAALKDERTLYRRVERTGPGKLRSTAKERRQESDDEVRSNLDPQMVPVFNAVRKQIKASPRMTRTEAFMHWVHENPDEWEPIVHAGHDREIAKLIGEYEKLERAHHRAKSGRSAVPF